MESVECLRLLIVDDNYDLASAMAALMKLGGHSADIVGNGQEALDQLDYDRHDLILMDLHMPVMGGIEAITYIRQRESATDNRIPIVAMTACCGSDTHEVCRLAGVDEILIKPVNYRVLLQTLPRLVRQHTISRESSLELVS